MKNKFSLFFAGDDLFVLPVRLQYIAADAQRHDWWQRLSMCPTTQYLLGYAHHSDSPLRTCAWTASIGDVEQPSQSNAPMWMSCLCWGGNILQQLHAYFIKSPHWQNSHPKDCRTLEWRPETVTKCTQVPPAFFLTLCLCHISKPVAKNVTVTSYLTIRHQAFNLYIQSLDRGHHF